MGRPHAGRGRGCNDAPVRRAGGIRRVRARRSVLAACAGIRGGFRCGRPFATPCIAWRCSRSPRPSAPACCWASPWRRRRFTGSRRPDRRQLVGASSSYAGTGDRAHRRRPDHLGPGRHVVLIDLGEARPKGWLRKIERLGIDPVVLLVMPRVVGSAIGAFCLGTVLVFSTLASGFLVARPWG